MPIKFLSARAYVLLWFAFVASLASAEIKVTEQQRRTWDFKDAGVRFDNHFPAARVNDCTQTGTNQFRILIQPENTPINNSPWFAFQVESDKKQEIEVILAYEDGKHRYHPKISHDGETWRMLGANAYRRDREKNEAVLTLK